VLVIVVGGREERTSEPTGSGVHMRMHCVGFGQFYSHHPSDQRYCLSDKKALSCLI